MRKKIFSGHNDINTTRFAMRNKNFSHSQEDGDDFSPDFDHSFEEDAYIPFNIENLINDGVEIPNIQSSYDAAIALKHLGSYLSHEAHNLTEQFKKEQNAFIRERNILDMDGAQFCTRWRGGIYTLNPIRTRLEWQTGEFPVFRTEARHYTYTENPFRERRRSPRRSQIFSIIDPATSEYIEYDHPENNWPVKGQLYISNLQLLFRVSKRNITPIPFQMIYHYHIYKNAIEVTYLKGKMKKTDVLFIDNDNTRIIEMILHALG